MAVTRIKNNQITDSTITYQKIASGTLVGSLFNENLTLNSNVSITGNLSIAGNTTTINSIDTLVSDSLLTLNNGYVGIPAYDVGVLFNRSLGTLGNYGGVNAALVWSESDGAFIVVLTTETGTTAGTINRAFKANMIVGNLTVSNAVAAQTATITTLNVTNTNLSGLTSTGNIVAASGQNATNYTTGAIVVPGGGGVGITGDLWVQGPSTFAGNIVAGNIVLSGNINVPVGGTFSNTGVFFGNAGGIGALYAGTTTYTALPTTVLQMSGNVDSYAQVNFQNINSGASASTDFVLTADNGNDTDGFLNLGINSSTFTDPAYPGFYPNDAYLVHHTAAGLGNLVIFSHEAGSSIKFHVGDYGDANTKVTVTNTGLRVNTTTTSTSTTSGALLVDGGLGVAGNIHAAAINATPIGNTTPSAGSFTYLVATVGVSTANAVISGGYINNLSNLTATTTQLTNLSTGNAVVSGGYINNLANLTATETQTTNFSTGNAVISGGYISALTNAYITTSDITNFSTGNAVISGGYAQGLVNVTATSGSVTTLVATNFSSGNAIITGGNITISGLSGPGSPGTFVKADHVEGFYGQFGNLIGFSSDIAGNFTGNLISSNVALTGGYIDDTPIGANTASTGAFTNVSLFGNLAINSGVESNSIATGALVITGGAGISGNLFIGGNLTVLGNTTTINTESLNVEDLNITVAANATSGSEANGAGLTVAGANATLTYVAVLDSWQVNKNLYGIDTTMVVANITTANITTVNTPTINVTTLNVTLANVITGNIDTLNTANGNVTTLVASNFSSPNAVITGGSINATSIGATTPNTGNFTTANATNVTAYTVTGTEINATNSNATTLAAANFSTANARITGGYADNFPIGANTAAPGYFTNVDASNSIKTAILNATANVYLSPQSGSATVTINPLSVGSIDNMSIGAINAANVYASNFRAATSLFAAPTGTVWLRGGTGTNGINNIPIGAVTPSSGVFTTVDGQTITGTTVNATNGNVTTLVATNFSTGNAVISGGYISALTNAYITTSAITNFSTANARVTGGFADNFPIGANTAAPGTFTTLSAAALNNTIIGNATPAAGTFTTLNASTSITAAGNLVITSGTTTVYTGAAGTANTTGALVITGTGGAAINGNLYVGQGAVINGNQTTQDTIVRGVNDRSLVRS
jgi:hypothetical protein